jgi:hypothetical protein
MVNALRYVIFLPVLLSCILVIARSIWEFNTQLAVKKLKVVGEAFFQLAGENTCSKN